MKFIIATNNPQKLIELERILSPLGINAVSPKDEGICLEDVEENGSTFMENSFIKADAACKKTGLPAIADDSGICVDALNGEPGIYSARFAGENATDIDKNNLILKRLENTPESDRGAHYTCAVTCVFPNGDKIQVEGKCFGRIAYEPDGDGGFGYDPIFLYNGVSFGKVSADEKDKVSHRGNALRMFKAELVKYLEENNVNK
ncbi:MAG: RdgB/HAM1 family non-canonical purine NTP pyrophosphatase [Ruminococcus sp.]|jgi:XTP/dITP diphosphohydrolase|nr:RdgB/HAM1 family non-canonical purine NTP pyrophosphatase [Ruminococcus sp.]